ncbi:lytic transglycosylase domain-containing protein [Rhodanobacter sp. FW106-PBR-LB-2-11]|uniref:lytic transglycosylase domain-containing protein n=1 Tax=Rhodanobacter sp. FW106-PBR-LB-2-11 TaxID=1524463 RepID=UPI0034E39F54
MERLQTRLLGAGILLPIALGTAHAAHALRTISEAGTPAVATRAQAGEPPAVVPAVAATAAPPAPGAASLPAADASPHPSNTTARIPSPAGVRTIASAAPIANTVCPEGMTAVTVPQGQIRQVGEGYDDVIGGQPAKACTTGPLTPSPPRRLATVADPPVRRSTRKLPESDPAVRKCVARAASAFGIHRLPLYLILDVEAGEVGQVSWNTNGTYDIGPAQINSWWLPTLAKAGITDTDLRQDLCTNIMVSGWIYARALHRTGSMVKAIALYHSPTEKHQYRYLGMIERAIERRLPHTETAVAAK